MYFKTALSIPSRGFLTVWNIFAETASSLDDFTQLAAGQGFERKNVYTVTQYAFHIVCLTNMVYAKF